MRKNPGELNICKRCNVEKMHSGHGYCCPCLRRTKRETKPSFYLGTCYSEMSRRVKTFDPLRPNYYGKSICTKEEFFNKFLSCNIFLSLYKKWQDSGFLRRMAPSIDRINNDLGYTLDNMQFIIHTENTGKSARGKAKRHPNTKVIDSDGIEYNSIKECASKNNSSPSNIRKYATIGKGLNGKRYYITENI
jgi:hypothetical protein